MVKEKRDTKLCLSFYARFVADVFVMIACLTKNYDLFQFFFFFDLIEMGHIHVKSILEISECNQFFTFYFYYSGGPFKMLASVFVLHLRKAQY